jgi:hypothetical protein
MSIKKIDHSLSRKNKKKKQKIKVKGFRFFLKDMSIKFRNDKRPVFALNSHNRPT